MNERVASLFDAMEPDIQVHTSPAGLLVVADANADRRAELREQVENPDGLHRDWFSYDHKNNVMKRRERESARSCRYVSRPEYDNGYNGWTDIHSDAECPFKDGPVPMEWVAASEMECL